MGVYYPYMSTSSFPSDFSNIKRLVCTMMKLCDGSWSLRTISPRRSAYAPIVILSLHIKKKPHTSALLLILNIHKGMRKCFFAQEKVSGLDFFCREKTTASKSCLSCSHGTDVSYLAQVRWTKLVSLRVQFIESTCAFLLFHKLINGSNKFMLCSLVT